MDDRFDFTDLDEPSMETEMSSITARSSSDGNPFLESAQVSELKLKVASLEHQLEAETQSKQRAEEMSAELQLKISELQNKLGAQATPSEEKPISEMEEQVAELQRRLETEVQERRTAEEKSATLELKVAELEKASEALLRSQNMCEQDALIRVQSDSDEMENLRRTISSITEEREQLQEILQALRDERDQLKSDLEKNVDLMIEIQAELRDAQEKVKHLRGEIHNLESERVQTADQHEDLKNQDQLQDQIKRLTEELSAAASEKERLLSERSDLHELSDAMEKIKADLALVTEERDQLQEKLQQMKTHLEEKNEMETACGSQQSASGIAVTPHRMEQMNLSSIPFDCTPDAVTTHSSGRRKAALSLRKKKIAFPTPRRLARSRLNSPADTSLKMFSSPLSTPSRNPPSRIQFTTNIPMISYSEGVSDAEKVYWACQQSGPISFSDCIPPGRMERCRKIGEGEFGEVFSTKMSYETVVLKIIPVEGSQEVNGKRQKTFGEILHDIIISKELSSLKTKENNQTDCFIGLKNLHCVRGCYPEALLKAWDEFDLQQGSENDRPDSFEHEQLFLILELEFGGQELENMNGKLKSLTQAKSVLQQVTAALAVAEQALCFEHRNLHRGNILVKTVKQKHIKFILNGMHFSIETNGVRAYIIGSSLSHLEIDGLTVARDLASEEELFMGEGDRLEVYRLMKAENNNCWSTYNPRSNVLWLHCLADKLINMTYRSKANSQQHRALKRLFECFKKNILNCASANEGLKQ